jgi:hypothetical protein
MELAVFVVALVLIVGAALLATGRMPFPLRRAAEPADEPFDVERRLSKATTAETRTAEPPGHVDDSG